MWWKRIEIRDAEMFRILFFFTPSFVYLQNITRIFTICFGNFYWKKMIALFDLPFQKTSSNFQHHHPITLSLFSFANSKYLIPRYFLFSLIFVAFHMTRYRSRSQWQKSLTFFYIQLKRKGRKEAYWKFLISNICPLY